jgi:hypothetical protein
MRINLAGSARSALIAAALTSVVSVPMWFVTHPLLYDYPFHLARLLVLHDILHGGALAKYYEVHSFIIPNVAMDIIGTGLQEILDIDNAGRAFLIPTIFLTISGRPIRRSRMTRSRGATAGKSDRTLWSRERPVWRSASMLLPAPVGPTMATIEPAEIVPSSL